MIHSLTVDTPLFCPANRARHKERKGNNTYNKYSLLKSIHWFPLYMQKSLNIKE